MFVPMCDSSKCIPLIPLEGAQLLCMTGKGLDACRYLQTYGSWTTAAWLAKVFQESPVTQTTFPNVNSCPYSLLSYFYFQVTHARTHARTHTHTHTHIHTRPHLCVYRWAFERKVYTHACNTIQYAWECNVFVYNYTYKQYESLSCHVGVSR